MKRIFVTMIFLVVTGVFLSSSAIGNPPAPPSLPSTAGVVRNDYTDTNDSKKIYYTVEQPDGTQTEVWVKEKNLDKLIRSAAAASRELTVWTETDGEVAAVQTRY